MKKSYNLISFYLVNEEGRRGGTAGGRGGWTEGLNRERGLQEGRQFLPKLQGQKLLQPHTFPHASVKSCLCCRRKIRGILPKNLMLASNLACAAEEKQRYPAQFPHARIRAAAE